MKIKRLLGGLLSVVLVLSLLTGCFYATADIRVDGNGAGMFRAAAGIEESAIESLIAMGGSYNLETGEFVPNEEIDLSELQRFQRNGRTYYGESEETTFDNLRQLNEMLPQDGETGIRMQLVRNEDGSLTLTFDIGDLPDAVMDEFMTDEELQDALGSMDGAVLTAEEWQDALDPVDGAAMTAEELQAEMESLGLVEEFTFTLPGGRVRQIEGPSEGVTIRGGTVTLDIVQIAAAMAVDPPESAVLRFTDAEDLSAVRPLVSFSDVASEAWYGPCVDWIAANGALNGFRDGTFRPDDAITAAQAAQIIAKVSGAELESGAGYWAAPAIEWCVEQGILAGRAGVTPADWDVPISRQEAVSAIVTAFGEVLDSTDSVSIPDLDAIAPAYRQNVVRAYSAGVVSGMDEAGTFAPEQSLKRSEFCKILDNLDYLAGLF